MVNPVQDWTKADNTVIVVSGDAYSTAYKDRDKVFLPEALTQREGDDAIQVFNEPSKSLYWRGIRIYDLDKPSIYTYNILADVEITEDRTLMYMFQAYQHIGAFVARTKDQRLINAVVSAKDEHFGSKIDLDYAYTSPSAEFSEVINKKRMRGSYIRPSSLNYYMKYNPVPLDANKAIKEMIAEWAYNDEVPENLQTLLKLLLRCEIKEPVSDNDEMPF